eukprot:Blabericola_migrator_1__2697@NODE_1767_length_3824_cov_33_091030_g1140_i0_p3_GENE_NODE_1767_length_3824_cov_33_091030_g1140_i0NODE_1767_length_3824_cov_33_091030_g1140_i0_p3_ORF_typecomplete_len121_score16_79_NODE_1767_length_3824_cov_33_091030_g1140_i027453107
MWRMTGGMIFSSVIKMINSTLFEYSFFSTVFYSGLEHMMIGGQSIGSFKQDLRVTQSQPGLRILDSTASVDKTTPLHLGLSSVQGCWRLLFVGVAGWHNGLTDILFTSKRSIVLKGDDYS